MPQDPEFTDESGDEVPGRELLGGAARLLRTLAHAGPAQLAFGPLAVARSVLLEVVPQASRLATSGPASWRGPWLALGDGTLAARLSGLPEVISRAEAALDGTLELAGERVAIDPPRTDFGTPSRPVRLELATLDLVVTLALASRVERFARAGDARTLALAHLSEALRTLPAGPSDAWEPQVVAPRTLNLALARELLAEPTIDGELAKHLARHAAWLVPQLALHAPATKLGEQAAALFVAGCVLDATGAGAWRTLGRELLARALSAEVLPDGGHVTRSPTLGARSLRWALVALAAARAQGHALPSSVPRAVDRLARWLLALSHPHGRAPLFRDSADDGAFEARDLAGALGLSTGTLHEALLGRVLAVAPVQEAPFARFEDTGALVVRDGATHLALLAAPAGPSDAARHAHADFGSFELSFDGELLVSEPGAGTFEPGPWRELVRSPAARTTVSVDGAGLDELWGGFFAGARGRLEPMVYVPGQGFHLVRLAATAAAGWRHERLLVLLPDVAVVVFDRVTGAGERAVLSHVQLGPATEVTALPDRLELAWNGLLGRFWTLVGEGPEVRCGVASPPAGWVARRFGRFEPAPSLVVRPAAFGSSRLAAWALVFGEGAPVQSMEPGAFRVQGHGAGVRVIADGRGLRWEHLRGG